MARRPIRIGNCSGAIGDGIDQIYELARIGQVDAITADYLAEFNMALRAIDMQSDPAKGYEPNFLEQLAWHDGDAARLVAEKGIKIVHDGGALNPQGLAEAADAYFQSLGITSVKIAWISGDDVTDKVRQGTLGGDLAHLDQPGVALSAADMEHMLSAHAYTGLAGIARALQAGADVVVCGRCCDASPVMGLAAWWHGWGPEDYDALAGSLVAGHLIECGAYVTGGNFCGADEIERLYGVGYPIAEIAGDGTVVITKPAGTAGAVTVDTCTAQLLYEIQGPLYLNPDVVAHLDAVSLASDGPDRVRVGGAHGSPPPATTKLAVCLHGGWQAELPLYAAGLQTEAKCRQLQEGVRRRLDRAQFSALSIERYGTAAADPASQAACTVMIRVLAQAPRPEPLAQLFQAIFYNGMQGYAGLHTAMDWRTLQPRPFVRYFPTLVRQAHVPLCVHLLQADGRQFRVAPRPARLCGAAPTQPSYEPARSLPDGGATVRRPLGDLVFARSGDKGGNANVGLWVRADGAWPWLQAFATSARLQQLLGRDWHADRHTVARCEFPRVRAVHFVVQGFLQEGVSSSSIVDGFGKSVAEFLRARHADLPADLVADEDRRRAAAAAKTGPYAKL